MDIPFMRLDRQYAARKEDLDAAVETVFTGGRVLQGPEVRLFEQALAKTVELEHAVAVGSGTDALSLSMRALGLEPGGRVAVTSLSFVASASSIIHAGGIPLFVDVDDYYLSRLDTLEELIESQTIDGIILVHLYGQMLETQDICEKAQAKGIFVIEDAAQALGATHADKPPGHFSDAACISFDPTKVIGAFGSGGSIVTHRKDMAEKCRCLRYHGQSKKGIYSEIGYNSQMHTVQAAMLLEKLKYLNTWQEHRESIAARYNDAIASLPKIQAPRIAEKNTHIYHKYVLRAGNDRDRLLEHLTKAGIGTAIHYATPLSKQPCFSGKAEITHGGCHKAEEAANEVLSLPIYPELQDEEVAYITEMLGKFFR